MVGVLTAVFKRQPTAGAAIVLVDRAISVFSIVVLGSIAYVISSKPRGGGMRSRRSPGERRPAGDPLERPRAARLERRTPPRRAARPAVRADASRPPPRLPYAGRPVVAAREVPKGHSRFGDRSDSSSIGADCTVPGSPTGDMTGQNGRAFNEWLRAQLKAKKMSQRQLAQQSGVDHSTISRLIRGDRMPSLGTATKLARGLREIRDDADAPQYLGVGRGRDGQPDRPRRVRPARRRGPVRAAGPPGHGVLPGRPDAPLRPRLRRHALRRPPMEPRRLIDDRRDTPLMSAAMAGHAVRPMVRQMPPRARTGREAS